MFRRFLAELKQRRVVQVAGIYAVTAWGIFQVANALFPALRLPSWSVTLTAILLILALPVVLIMSWALESTPQGIRLTRSTAPAGTRFGPGDWTLLVVALAVVVVAGLQMAGIVHFGGRAAPAAPQIAEVPARSIAVLPFTTFREAQASNDPAMQEAQLFADGLTEEVINSLAQVQDLRVAGRTSAFYFRNRNEDLRQIGRQLGVAHVLEGSVRREGQRLRVTVQLIKVSDGFHMWSQTYDRELSDAFAVQTEIANAVAQVLEARLIAERPAARPRNAEAYQLEVTAQALLRTLGLTEARRARQNYQRIIALEPDNAEAHARLAQATMLLAQNYLALNFDDARREAEREVARALELDPNSAAAWTAKGFLNNILLIRTGEGRYIAEADAAFRRALTLSPRNPDVETYYGNFLVHAGRSAEAITHLDAALATDPLNRVAQLTRAGALNETGRTDDAIAQYRAIIELYPDFIDARQNLGLVLVSRGRLAEAEPWLRQAAAPATDPSAAIQLAHVYLNLGMTDDALRIIEAIREPAPAAAVAQAAAMLVRGDYAGLTRLSESRFAIDHDPIWRQGIFTGALMTGDDDRARAQAAAMAPELFQAAPVINTTDFVTPVSVAHVLREQGDQAQARRILDAVLAATTPQAGHPQTRARRLGRIAAYAELGDNDHAVEEFRAAYDDGFRTLWDIDAFMRIDAAPMMAGVRVDPRFRAIITQIEADMARQRQAVLASRRATPPA